jgi:hypothetical protein
MKLPGFSGEASIYKTRRSYQGRCSVLSMARPSGGIAPQQVSCEDNCKAQWVACLGASVVGCPPGAVPICLALCSAAYGFCVNSCPSGGDGGGGAISGTQCAPGLIRKYCTLPNGRRGLVCCPPGVSCEECGFP